MSTEADKQEAKAWYRRYRSLRMKLALFVGGAALIFGAMLWFGKKMLSVAPASGVPLGFRRTARAACRPARRA